MKDTDLRLFKKVIATCAIMVMVVIAVVLLVNPYIWGENFLEAIALSIFVVIMLAGAELWQRPPKAF